MKLDRPYGKPGAGAPVYQSYHRRQKTFDESANVPPPQESEDEEVSCF